MATYVQPIQQPRKRMMLCAAASSEDWLHFYSCLVKWNAPRAFFEPLERGGGNMESSIGDVTVFTCKYPRILTGLGWFLSPRSCQTRYSSWYTGLLSFFSFLWSVELNFELSS